MKWRFRLSRHLSQPASCASIESLLSLYSDGMASARETRQVESHLAACPDCQRALNWMQATHFVISNRPPVPLPSDLRARITRAITEAEPSSLPVRTVRRPVVLRPASLAAAASLTVAAILMTHPPHVVPRRAEVIRPMRTAHLPASRPIPGIPVEAALQPAMHPAKQPRVAAAPPRTTVGLPVLKAHAPAVARIARASAASLDDAQATPGPAATHAQSLTAVPPAGAVHMAARPMDKPRAAAPAPPRNIMVATKLPETPISRKGEEAVVTSSPELAAPSPPKLEVDAGHPDVTRVAVVTPAHEDVLSSVRASLPTFQRAAVKVYRDSSARFQTASYRPNSKFVLATLDYTPTTLPDTKPVPEH